MSSVQSCRHRWPAEYCASHSVIPRSVAPIAPWRSIAARFPVICALLSLAKLRPLRRKTFRFRQEQEAIEAWLRLIVQAASLSAELAIEIAECAGLIKGYGDTHRRGSANYDAIATQVIAPALAGVMPVATGHRCRCQRAHGGARRPGRRSSGEVSCRPGKRAGARYCRRIATKTQTGWNSAAPAVVVSLSA